jgi:cyanophycinase
MLAGGAEFGGRMAEPDLLAIEHAGGPDAPIRIIPAAAAPDNNHQRAGRIAVAWFRSLGARDVAALPLVDSRSAADAAIVGELRAARLIYMLGGFPGHLARSLAGSPAWDAACAAYADGAVLAGSSAGAMVMCRWLYDPGSQSVGDGLGLVPGACVLPHHDTYGQRWVAALERAIPDATLVGIDERTAVLGVPGGMWKVAGQGAITIYRARASWTSRDEVQF